LGNFVEHLVGAQKPKGLKTPFKTTQPPAQTTQNPTKTMGHNPKMDLCPQSTRKNEKIKKNLKKNGFSGRKMGKNEKKWLMDGRRWVGWSEKGRRWDGGWLGGDGRR
jgi:hypothetical protein